MPSKFSVKLKRGESEMNVLKRVEKGCFMVVFLVASVGAMAGQEAVLTEGDFNKDGKTDRWYWLVDDCLTTKLLDLDCDGIPDQCNVYRIIDGKRRMVQMWRDENSDGEIDGLTVSASGIGSNGIRETWRKLSGDKPAYKYWRRDPKSDLLTVAEVSGIGLRPTDQDKVTTSSLSELAKSAPVHVRVDENTEGYYSPDGKPLMIKLKVGENTFVTEEFVYTKNAAGLRQVTTIREVNGLRVVLKEDSEGRFIQVSWEEPAGKGVMAEDMNGDGRFDHFETRHKGVTQRQAYDADHDGLLDRVENYPGGAAGTVLIGDQIPDRSLPKLPDLALSFMQ